MSLESLLEERRRSILDDWYRKISETYPGSVADFPGKGRDRFANPVGSTITEGIEALFDALLRRADREELGILLDPTVRLRAVQSFMPSEAIGYVFALKGSVRRALASEIRKGRFAQEFADLDARIDSIALVAFDAYMACREQLTRIRVSEAQRATKELLKRSGLAVAMPDAENPPPPEEGRKHGVTR